ncbi:hypothetical protein C1T21_19455 [Paenibacillus sp. F4]|nr:hypothetical protein C1T21_19455 [Paenibacillus sp. F4]
MIRLKENVFFRWIKQHLNIPTRFGTTENAVYGQLFSALIVYVLLKTMYDRLSLRVPKHEALEFVRFARLLLLNKLAAHWRYLLYTLNMKDIFHP